MMYSFRTVLGIDQTGAARKRGTVAKPLPVCLGAQLQPGRWRITAVNQVGNRPLQMSGLTPSALNEIRAQSGLPVNHGPLAVVVDAVLGLPESVGCEDMNELWEIVSRTQDYSGYGLRVGKRFFSDLLDDGNELLLQSSKRSLSGFPLRECDRLAKANTVFSPRPFQRNVQTGTYRIWKDLSSQGRNRWFRWWPFENGGQPSDGEVWLFEGYPGYMRRQFFRAVRKDDDAAALATASLAPVLSIDVDSATIELFRRDRNVEDAALLVFGTLALMARGRLWEPWDGFSHSYAAGAEGWITGLVAPEAAATGARDAGVTKHQRVPG